MIDFDFKRGTILTIYLKNNIKLINFELHNTGLAASFIYIIDRKYRIITNLRQCVVILLPVGLIKIKLK